MKDKPKFSLGDVTAAFEAGFLIGRNGNAFESMSCVFPATKRDVEQLQEHLDMKLSELKGSLGEIKTQVSKIATEQQVRFDALSAKVTQLEEQLADAEIGDEATATLNEVKAALQALDDTIPDPLPPEATPV